jgi:hypothetical protein
MKKNSEAIGRGMIVRIAILFILAFTSITNRKKELLFRYLHFTHFTYGAHYHLKGRTMKRSTRGFFSFASPPTSTQIENHEFEAGQEC